MNIDVSIVIVCMNNLKNLYPCLESIKKYTTVSYETLVVAYLFSKENLEKVKKDFPWVTFIESNEIRGFSENNNLALRQAKGKYCFVLNDDTFMDIPVIDRLVDSIEKQPSDVAIMSPKGLFPDGSLQSCGRPIHSFWTYIAGMLRLYNEQNSKSKLINQQGVFETGTVVGAYFLIKTSIFKEIGFFNEKYFFCPEDIEVGDEVRSAFLSSDSGAADAFRESRPGHWLCSLAGLARRRLEGLGLRPRNISDCGLCTLSDPQRFFSYRRDGRTGRGAAFIWMDPY